jgi:hypothetical protein
MWVHISWDAQGLRVRFDAYLNCASAYPLSARSDE